MDYYNEIYQNLGNYQVLERLFRESPLEFRQAFKRVYEDNPESHVLEIWRVRLEYQGTTTIRTKPSSHSNIVRLIAIAAVVALLVNLPVFFDMDELFYPIFGPTIILLGMSIYFMITEKPPKLMILAVLGVFGVAIIYLATLHAHISDPLEQTLTLGMMNMPFFLWTISGMRFMAKYPSEPNKRVGFIKITGEILIYTAIIVICFGTLLVIGSLLSPGRGEFFDFFIEDYAMPIMLSAAPIAAIGLAKQDLGIRRIPGYIARLLSPIILIIMVIYGVSLAFAQTNPMHDRELIIGLNGLLLGIMSVIFFVLSERRGRGQKNFGDMITFATVIIAILLDVFNISAIMYRTWLTGLTATRFVVIGVNILFLINLLGISFHMWRFIRDREDASGAIVFMVKYIPVYVIWTFLVAFVLPVFF